MKTPVQAHYATTPVLSYTSYAQFQSDLTSGAITFPYKWVMYDPENWAATPVNEQQDPVKYMTLFGQLAHANGLKVIQGPALDLATVTGPVLPRETGESADQWFVRVNIAWARLPPRVTSSSSRTSRTPPPAAILGTRTTPPRARRRPRTPALKVFSEVSTVNGTAAQMATAAQSISPDGYYVAASPGTSRRPTSSSR